MENDNREASAEEISQYMVDLDNYRHGNMSKCIIESPFPSLEVQISSIGTTSNFENLKDDYQHAMKCMI